MISTFFKNDEFFIDEKVAIFKLSNEYKVYNNTGEQVGAVRQQLTPGQKALKLFVKSNFLPFEISLYDSNDQLLCKVSRGWTFFLSKISLTDGQGQPMAEFNQKFKIFKPTFEIKDPQGNDVGSITGDWMAWNFNILDKDGNEIGVINKKWAGSLKEIFTTADKYHVKINPEVKEDQTKAILLSVAITIDMVLKENQNG